MAHAACSLDEPDPKFFPPTRILPSNCVLFNTKSFFGESSELYLQSLNKLSPKPNLSVAFKNLAGII